MSQSGADRHYSYSVYADPATASAFDDKKFGGPIGNLVADTQRRVISNFIGRIHERSILDVGTGTGRAALMLARGGAHVTGVDASEAMLAVARKRAADESLTVDFRVGNAHALEFPDRSFDVVVCLRVLMHTPGWQVCLTELCRVARRLVVIDYPSARSAALVESVARRVLHGVGVDTEPYRVFTDRRISEALGQAGFRVRSIHRQFVMPIALHKAIGSRRFTQVSEQVLDRAGLLRLMGSPVSLVAERCVS